jgi:anti-anti-sigma factor
MTNSELEGGIKVISLTGRMDISGTQEIDISFTVALASEAANIIVDLSGVEFIASIGIGLLVRAANTLLLKNGKIVFINPKPNVQNALEATHIHKVIPILNDIESAKMHLKN